MGPFNHTDPVVKETLTEWFSTSEELFVELYLQAS
jgi:hypothetical protein